MAGRRSRHECRSLGQLALKGLPDPVETVEVLWEPLGEADAEPWSRCRAVWPCVRRWVWSAGTPRWRRSSDAFKRVAGGEGREVVLVSGEAGLGKTTLVAEAARVAFDGGACVLFGHCEEDLATPYQLFAEALGHFVTHAPEEQLVAHVDAHGSELARLVPALASRLPGLPPSKATDADTERYQLFAAVVGLLVHGVAAAAGRAWCWMTCSGRTRRACSCCVTWSRRTSRCGCSCWAPTATVSCRARIRCSTRWPRCIASTASARIELAGLDDTGVVAFMEAAAGHTLDDAGGGSRPRGASRDRRQPVLRERGAPPPRRDRRDLPGRHRPVGRRTTPSSGWRCPPVSAR